MRARSVIRTAALVRPLAATTLFGTSAVRMFATALPEGMLQKVAPKLDHIGGKHEVLWKKNHELGNQLATIIAESALRHGITDTDQIKQVVSALLFHPDRYSPSFGGTLGNIFTNLFNQFNETNKILSGKKVDEHNIAMQDPKDLQQWITSLLNVFSCNDADSILVHFFEAQRNGRMRYTMESFALIMHSGIDQEYIGDMLLVQRFLRDTNAVEEQLDQLEKELQTYAAQLPADKQLPVRADGKFILSSSAENPYQRHKILSGFLKQWAQENGFTNYVKIITALTKKQFLELLANKTFFKDCATNAGDNHGVWSHALQWYLIVEQQKKTGFLTHPAIDVYQQLGERNKGIYNQSAWNVIVDRYEERNYTSPEFVTHKFCNEHSTGRWPLLAETIKRSQSKIEHKFKNRGEYTERLKKKHKYEEDQGVVRRKF